MKVPNGDIVTQFDLHDSEAVSLIKIDLLSVEALDKMHVCLDLLCDQNIIIPLDNNVESLNVGVAGAILMWELKK